MSLGSADSNQCRGACTRGLTHLSTVRTEPGIRPGGMLNFITSFACLDCGTSGHSSLGSDFFCYHAYRVSTHLFIYACIYAKSPEKAMAPHSSTLAWKIPWTEEPCRLQSMGLLRVRHDWATSLSLFTFMHWRWKWQLTPVFLPGESQGQRSLVGCRLWGRTESDTTEVT